MQEYTAVERRLVLIASCMAIFVNPLIGSMLNLALNAIGSDLHCSAHQLGWIASIFFISSVAAMVPAARLADIIGKRRVFIAGALIALVSLLLCTLSQDIYMLYLFRGMSGIGTACISSTSISMIADVYPKERRGSALAWNTACVYVGASIGPSLGGVITDVLGWRYVFVLVVPFLLIGIATILRFPYNIANTKGEPFDAKGSAIYVVAVLLVMFGLISLPEAYAAVMMAAGFLVLGLFVREECRTEYPVMHLSLFRNSRFTRSLAALFLNYAASYSISFFLSLYLQNIGRMTPTEAGMMLMVQPVVQVIFTLLAGRVVDRMDLRILPTVGMSLTLVGIVILFVSLGLDFDPAMIYVSLAVMGMGFGLFSSPNTTATMAYVDRADYNKASALIATMRQVGMTTSMGIATCLISVYLGTSAAIAPENYPLLIEVMRTGWIVCIAFCAVGALFSWFRGRTSDVV
ncbi:MAG: MFS transporter [Candidatus Methanomethylophilaceae archaeon]